MVTARLTKRSPFKKEIEELKLRNLYRSPETVAALSGSRMCVGARQLVNFSSNDYLGLSRHPFVIQKASEALTEWGAGSGASRLLSGNLAIHEELEKRLAIFKKEKAARIFSSGYLANLGAVTALLNEKDLVLCDRFNHASLIDAARLSRAKFRIYPHRDVKSLDRMLAGAGTFRRKLVVTDAYFSMDGHVAPLDRILEVCKKRGAMLMIDEAHSTGVFGRTGRGLTEHYGLSGQIDVVMGTLSKALGSVGGFVSGGALLSQVLTNRAKEFIYTTAPSPPASAAALASLDLLEKEPARLGDLRSKTLRLRQGLCGLGLDLMGSEGPIIPIRIGDSKKALAVKSFLEAEGYFAPAIRPPTVPKGTDRIRLSVTALHSNGEIDGLVAAIKEGKRRLK